MCPLVAEHMSRVVAEPICWSVAEPRCWLVEEPMFWLVEEPMRWLVSEPMCWFFTELLWRQAVRLYCRTLAIQLWEDNTSLKSYSPKVTGFELEICKFYMAVVF